jgi:low temperature requirement protein LtrA
MEIVRSGLDEAGQVEREQRVTTLELFFDLVFVFTLTQLTALLAGELHIESAARVVLVFVVLFWMYGGYAWLTNAVPPDRPGRQLLLLLGMGAFLVCALAIPRAFDGGGVAFGIGYLLVVLVHSGLYTQVYGTGVLSRLAPLNVASALCVTLAGLFAGPIVYALWVLAIAIQFVTPLLARSGTAFEIRPAHFVERHGLLLIVALGESVIAIGIGLGDLALGPDAFAAALLGLALAAALWWAYFAGDEGGAERTMAAASAGQRFGLAINGYFFAFIPMLLGIVVLAAGVKKSIGNLGIGLDPAPALALAGGVTLFLVGDVAFRRVMAIRPVAPRAAGAILALGTIVLGLLVGAGAQLVALVAILAIVLAAEARARMAAAAGG